MALRYFLAMESVRGNPVGVPGEKEEVVIGFSRNIFNHVPQVTNGARPKKGQG